MRTSFILILSIVSIACVGALVWLVFIFLNDGNTGDHDSGVQLPAQQQYVFPQESVDVDPQRISNAEQNAVQIVGDPVFRESTSINDFSEGISEAMLDSILMRATDLEDDGWYRIEENDSYYLDFLSHAQLFWIVIKAMPIDFVRQDIQDFLVDFLSAQNPSDLCGLRIDVVVQGQFEDSRDAVDVGLPACPGPYYLD
jgi:hypothetical protein